MCSYSGIQAVGSEFGFRPGEPIPNLCVTPSSDSDFDFKIRVMRPACRVPTLWGKPWTTLKRSHWLSGVFYVHQYYPNLSCLVCPLYLGPFPDRVGLHTRKHCRASLSQSISGPIFWCFLSECGFIALWTLAFELPSMIISHEKKVYQCSIQWFGVVSPVTLAQTLPCPRFVSETSWNCAHFLRLLTPFCLFVRHFFQRLFVCGWT